MIQHADASAAIPARTTGAAGRGAGRAIPFAIAALVGSSVLGQPGGAAPSADGAPVRPATPVTLADAVRAASALEPPVRLGAISGLLQQAQRVVPMVVVVPDEASYLAVISGWRGTLRWPVLIDDGTLAAREDIARFVRAFAPRRIARFPAPGVDAPDWPAQPAARREAITDAWLIALGGPAEATAATPPDPARPKLASAREAIDALAEQGFTPIGVVAMDPANAAWTGGLALAIARFQVIAFVNPPRRVPHSMYAMADVETLSFDVAQALDAMGLLWRAQGDDVDALTLAFDGPARVKLDEQTPPNVVALTDVLGRTSGGVAPLHGPRWAWTGRLTGTAAKSAYDAMCSLFLTHATGWVFDAYDSTGAWGAYDGTRAAETARRAGYTVTVFDAPKQGLGDWRAAAARGIDGGLVLINSSGNPDFFNLKPGVAASGDVPMLRRPAIVHMVHSWSARSGGDERFIAGRWLRNGAFAYLGSVQEPYLQAFVPTPAVATRLTSGIAWGPAVRANDDQPWKLECFGDPLLTLGPVGQRVDEVPTLSNAVWLDEQLRAATDAGDLEGAALALLLTGREEDLTRVVRAAIERGDAAPALVTLGLPALVRAGEFEVALRGIRALPAADRATLLIQDLMWTSARRVIASKPDASLEEFLTDHLREGTEAADLLEVGELRAKRAGPAAAAALLEAAKPRLEHDHDRRRIDQRIAQYRGTARPGQPPGQRPAPRRAPGGG